MGSLSASCPVQIMHHIISYLMSARSNTTELNWNASSVALHGLYKANDLGPSLQNFVKWTFVILSQFFCISFICQLISYRTKSLRKNCERITKEIRRNYDVYKYLFVNKMAHMWIPNTKVSKNRLLLHDLSDNGLYRMTRFPRWAVNELLTTRELRESYE